jgi:hypothetical protein
MNRTARMQIVLLQYMPLAISNGFNVLHKYTEQTAEFYDKWQKEQLMLSERSHETVDKDNRELLNLRPDLRSELQLILFNSTFISSVALFETQFKQICEILETNQNRLNDTKGDSTIHKFYNFISKKIGVDLTAKNTLFESLKTYNQIRNKVVHEQASIQGEPDLVKKINKMKNICVEEPAEGYFEIKITDCNFIYEYIKIVREYLNFVNEEVLKRITPPNYLGIPSAFIPYE